MIQPDTPKSIGEPIGRVARIGKNFLETDSKKTLANGDGLCYIRPQEQQPAKRFGGFQVNSVEGRHIIPAQMPDIAIGTMLYRNYDRLFDKQLQQKTAERKLPFVAGHALNCYNAVTLKILLKQGMMRWCMPVELSRDWLVNLLNQCDELGIRNQFEVEVLSYGHLPLAYSARCFTARSEDRPKDECETCCIKYPNGRNVLSQENQQVFVLNGIQTMSGYVYNLGNELASMQGLVDVVRLSPQGTDTFAMLDAFRANENGAAPLPLTANSDCNGYWRRLAGLELQA